MFIVALIVNAVLHYLVDVISDIDPGGRDRLLPLGAIFWWISIPFNLIVLFFYLYEFLRDFKRYSFKYSFKSSEERAKKYSDSVKKLADPNLSTSEFPQNREALFKTAIVNNSYCWQLNRYIGRVEDYADIYLKQKEIQKSQEEQQLKLNEHEELRLESEFNKLLK